MKKTKAKKIEHSQSIDAEALSEWLSCEKDTGTLAAWLSCNPASRFRFRDSNAQPWMLPIPFFVDCISEIQADPGMNSLQRQIAISHLLERENYKPPKNADPEEIKRVLLSAARAEARLWYPPGLSVEDTKKRMWLHRFIMADENDEKPAPPFKMSLSEWSNFFRSADQARQSYRGQIKFSPTGEEKFHPSIKSIFLPLENFWIVYWWASPKPEKISLAHCSAELACEIIAETSEGVHEAKNFGRKRNQLGLVSFSRSELRGHLLPTQKQPH